MGSTHSQILYKYCICKYSRSDLPCRYSHSWMCRDRTRYAYESYAMNRTCMYTCVPGTSTLLAASTQETCTCPIPGHSSAFAPQDQRASLHQGPHVESRIRSGATGRSASQNVSILLTKEIFIPEALLHTFVPLQPNRYAASFATSSPKPNMSPLTNGRNRLMAAPRSNPQIVGGL